MLVKEAAELNLYLGAKKDLHEFGTCFVVDFKLAEKMGEYAKCFFGYSCPLTKLLVRKVRLGAEFDQVNRVWGYRVMLLP